VPGCVAGGYEANFKTVLTGLREAQENRLDIVAFPESLLTGYYDCDQRAREHSFAIEGPEIARLLDQTRDCPVMFMVGFNELRGGDIYNTVLVGHRGKLLGAYSKAFPCYDYFTPGRDFPVFDCQGVKFGIVICADGGYVEPTRILALKGARIIFAPHYNLLDPDTVVDHFYMVRHDHIARAVENGVWFLRANTIGQGRDEGMNRDGVGYGDSYLLDPNGQIVAHAGLHRRGLMFTDVDMTRTFRNRPACLRSRKSAMVLGDQLIAAAKSHQDDA
jgi:predicted amidohydrolase